MASIDSSARSSASLFSSNTQSTTDSHSLTPTYDFVVAGGSYAAIHAVKIICKHIIPKAVQQNPNFRAHITVIAPNKETYWNVAAVRLISEPEVMKAHSDQIFFPLEETLRRYLPKSTLWGPHSRQKHELHVIQGKVVSLDSANSMLTYLMLTDSGSSQTDNDFFCHTVSFDKLILATGASSSSPAFKLNGSTQLTKEALRELQESAKNASSICIVGAGGAGVELAGELGYKYGQTKKITLFSAFDGTLERLRPKIADEAVTKLQSLGVTVVTSSRAISAYKEKPLPRKVSYHPPSVSSDSDMESTGPQTPTSPRMSPLLPDTPEDLNSGTNHEDIADMAAKSRRSTGSPKKNNLKSAVSHDYFRGIHSSKRSTQSLQKKASEDALRASHGTCSSPHYPDGQSFDFQEVSSNPIASTIPRTVVAFENGYREAFDCYIPTTGNIPNSSYLPQSCLDNNGYVETDPYLRMLHNNYYNNIYVYGDLVSGGNQSISDICEEQKDCLQATLMHDIFESYEQQQQQQHHHHYQLKKYKPSRATFYVPISRKSGVGQTMYGLPIPGFIVSIVKGKTFRLAKSKKYLDA